MVGGCGGTLQRDKQIIEHPIYSLKNAYISLEAPNLLRVF